MSGPHAFRAPADARFSSGGRWRFDSAPHTPWQNQIIAAVPREDYERLLPDLEPVSLSQGSTLYGAGDRKKHVYFLTAGIVSRLYVLENGDSAEFAVTGSEGAIGVASFLSGDSTPRQALVLGAG